MSPFIALSPMIRGRGLPGQKRSDKRASERTAHAYSQTEKARPSQGKARAFRRWLRFARVQAFRIAGRRDEPFVAAVQTRAVNSCTDAEPMNYFNVVVNLEALFATQAQYKPL
jgi:hypothetical protein